MSASQVIDSFCGQYAFLSNFYAYGDGYTVEHFFQAAKTLNTDEAARMLDAATPAEAKRLGRRVQLRPDWEQRKVSFMAEAVWWKFRLHPDLARQLLGTGDALLVEGNTWHDNVWGDCRCGVGACRGPGMNHLGVILMTVRTILGANR